ncbi:hypothetical protein IV498_00185 [Paenarthrobacter sp. Z7-10]|uniref:hypothetical protein n=1 Tax=Paenarthrobacter sp. Z7-10 TaxID=2787635 RepID=UPI0022A8DA61|nr:hypothetical protein [Paenarthrobacter sp. Z7-10]MCZ2401641.1 hypothetical protein [Paenarthrobacter sp. Z7-10]
MNGTHRGLNRLLLALLGLILIAAGAITAAAGATPSFAADWSSNGATAWAWTLAQIRSVPIGSFDVSWWTIAALALLVVAVVLLLCWIFSQGGGRSGRIGSRDSSAGSAADGSGNAAGSTTIEASLATRAIRDALEENDQVLSANVSAWKVKQADGLRIAIQARKGSSPRQVTDAAEETVRGLDELLGIQVPVLVRINSGLRSRFTGAERVH